MAATPTMRLAIAQYQRQGFPDGYEHWALVAAVPGKPDVQVFQIEGNTDTYYFATKIVKVLRSNSLQGGYEVGRVVGEVSLESDNVQWLKTHLATLPIVHNDPNWHCQRWVIDAIRDLQGHKDRVEIRTSFSHQATLKELKKQREIWNVAEKHYFELLIDESHQA